MLSWLKSPLFWKIVGIYVLLSTLALGGLLLTLSQTLEQNTRRFLESDARHFLTRIQGSLPESPRADDVAAISLPDTQRLYLCDNNGQVLSNAQMPVDSSPNSVSTSLRRTLIERLNGDRPNVQWKSASSMILCGAIGISGDFAEPHFLVLAEDNSGRFNSASAGKHSTVQAAIVAWLCGTVCLAFVATTVVGPARTLLQVIRAKEGSLERRDMLLTLAERTDEFGDVARSLMENDDQHTEHLNVLEINETGLRSTATQLSAILQAMADGVIAVDQSERILFANTVACQLLKLPATPITGRPVFEVARNRHLQDAVTEALAKVEEVTIEFRVAQSDRDVMLVVSPIPDRGAVLVLHDTTELRKLERMRRDFVSGVSHELKTPLTVIQACTETLLDGALEDIGTARNFLQQIDEQSERLLQLVLGMLQLARVESGAQVLTLEPVDLHDIAETTLRSLRPVAEGRDISVSLTGEEELFVLGDYQALRTVAGSLVDNAIKYTPAGGEVTIHLASDEDVLRFQVSDNGPGIPLKDQVRVFERFYRVERDRNREHGGTGLGLSIVKHLCHAMNADIGLESEVGKGCIIEVRFPIDDD